MARESEMRAKPVAQVATHVGPSDDAKNETVRPPFDPDEFARESDSKMRAETDPASARPTAPPPPGLPQYQAGLTSGTMHALASVGSDAVPSLAVAREDLEWFALPTPTRTLLERVDGTRTIAALGADAGMALDAAMAAFHQLERDGLVTLRR
jgi:hypothetical protein